jgi:hypothetical protein
MKSPWDTIGFCRIAVPFASATLWVKGCWYVFSEWKKTQARDAYPSHVIGIRFVDLKAGTLADNQWYQTDILEITPLAELPIELKQ